MLCLMFVALSHRPEHWLKGCPSGSGIKPGGGPPPWQVLERPAHRDRRRRDFCRRTAALAVHPSKWLRLGCCFRVARGSHLLESWTETLKFVAAAWCCAVGDRSAHFCRVCVSLRPPDSRWTVFCTCVVYAGPVRARSQEAGTGCFFMIFACVVR